MIYESFIFLDGSSTSGTSNSLVNINNDQLTLEVENWNGEDINVQVQGKIDINATWTNLSAIDSTTLKIVNIIETKGIYLIPISGISRIRVVSGGSIGNTQVLGKVIV